MDTEKEVKHDKGLIEQIHRMSYYYKNYINICGNCRSNARIFNDLEETKLNIEKQQIKLICEEREAFALLREPANEPENEPDTDIYVKYFLILFPTRQEGVVRFYVGIRVCDASTPRPPPLSIPP